MFALNKKNIVGFAILVCVALILGSAGTGFAMTKAEFQLRIDAILSQLAELQAKLEEVETDTISTPMGEETISGCAIASFDRELRKGTTGDDVECLQIILNADVETQLSDKGVGSRGNETKYFGSITKAGVIKFQKKYSEDIGYVDETGFVNSATRIKLNSILNGDTQEEQLEEIPFKNPSEINNGFDCVGYGYYWGPNGCYSDENDKIDVKSDIVTITNVVDGDTFDVLYSDNSTSTIRLLGVDTPETYIENKPYEYGEITNLDCLKSWGEEATKYAEGLLANKEVILFYDSTAGERGKCKRLLAYVEVNEQDFGTLLLQNGYARVYTKSDFEKKNYYITLQQKAKTNKDGLWSCSEKCECGDWTDIGCGKGDCGNNQMLQRRDCNPDNCNFETLCVEKSICSPSCNWQNITTQKTGLGIVKAEESKNYINKEKIVEGNIADVFRSSKNNVFLNFNQKHPNQCFSVLIYSSYQHKFIQNFEKCYNKKRVRIKGKIQEYKGKPQIKVYDPSQIEVCQ